jgi:muconate cycloisomerase
LTGARIRSVQAIAVAVPLHHVMRMAGVRISHAENLIVRIETEDGQVGWGEAASAPTMSGDLQASMVAAVEQVFAPLLVGQDPLQRARLMKRIEHAVHRNTGAKCAVECALYDLCGKLMGVPVFELLGGARRDELRPMHLLGNEKVEDDVREAQGKLAQGIRFFKIKIGVKPVEQEIRSTRLLREALGPDVTLCADGNMGLGAQQIQAYCEGVKDQGLLFLEQPLRSDNLLGMARLARSLAIPLCGDESVGSAADLVALSTAGAVAGVNLKTIKFGGLAPVVHASHLCEALGLAINLACKVGETSIAAAAVTHLGLVMSNLDWGISLTNHYLADDLALHPVAPVDGVIRVPRTPGLGITVDEARVDQYRV